MWIYINIYSFIYLFSASSERKSQAGESTSSLSRSHSSCVVRQWQIEMPIDWSRDESRLVSAGQLFAFARPALLGQLKRDLLCDEIITRRVAAPEMSSRANAIGLRNALPRVPVTHTHITLLALWLALFTWRNNMAADSIWTSTEAGGQPADSSPPPTTCVATACLLNDDLTPGRLRRVACPWSFEDSLQMFAVPRRFSSHGTSRAGLNWLNSAVRDATWTSWLSLLTFSVARPQEPARLSRFCDSQDNQEVEANASNHWARLKSRHSFRSWFACCWRSIIVVV